MLNSQHRYQSPMALVRAVMHLCVGSYGKSLERLVPNRNRNEALIFRPFKWEIQLIAPILK